MKYSLGLLGRGGKELTGDEEIILSQLDLNISAVITSIDTKDQDTLKKLMALGVLPGVNIKLLRKYPSYLFEAGNTRIAADEKIASSIWVKLQ